MDRIGADFNRVNSMIFSRFNSNPIPVQIPYYCNDRFSGVIDIISMKLITYEEDSLGEKYELSDVPQEYYLETTRRRDILLENIAEFDDEILKLYLEDKRRISEDQIRKVLRKATIQLKAIPVLCGAAFKNIGIQPVIDAVVDYLPSPLDVPPINGKTKSGDISERKASNTEPFSALAFKIMTDPFFGQLTYIRVYSGVIKSGTSIYNSTRKTRERVSRLLRIHANKREDISELHAGDIGAIGGFHSTITGDTLCDEKSIIELAPIEFPIPVISVAIEPKTKADQDKLASSLQKMALEDPSFKVKLDEETSQTIISGMGELHLDIIVDRLTREFHVNASVGKPMVAYRETITNPATSQGRYIKQAGGRGHYGVVQIRVEPSIRGKGNVFISEIGSNIIPKEFIPSIKEGIRESMENGILAGYPVVDVKTILTGGSFHEVDSTEIAFKIAASLAFKEAYEKAEPSFLEPIMSIEIITPDEYAGVVIKDFNSKRGKIDKTESRVGIQEISGKIPLAETFGYATAIRSLSQGRATYTMQFSQYSILPKNIFDALLAKFHGGSFVMDFKGR